ncbi:hypothetical protein HanRHA438_Chr03g0113711 [Helianthus annuus]|nr:hypothetical protein HanRHA438_Chr03g0113711 [Helianthus annuus]
MSRENMCRIGDRNIKFTLTKEFSENKEDHNQGAQSPVTPSTVHHHHKSHIQKF